jgi:two-component system sensor histidine kinase KdpD
VAGAVVVLAGLPVLVAALVGQRRTESLATPVLLVLLVVVAGALIGGLRVGVPAAVAGGLVLNWFFTVPYGTLSVERPSQLLVLGVYLAVGLAVSLVVGRAARQEAEAVRARAEAQALMSLAGAALAEQQTLPAVLDQVRRTFGVHEAALLERDGDEWVAVAASSGGAPPEPDEGVLEHQVSPTLRLRVRGRPLFGEDQRVLHAFAETAASALEGRRLAERAATAKELEATDRVRTALLAAVSHDLRTPLAGVKAAVSSLRQSDVAWTGEEIAQLLQTIESSADRLQSLLENLLDASRLQADAVSVDLEPVTLEEVLDRALLSLPVHDRVLVELPEDLPAVLVDVGLAERVFGNLLDNALRHSPAGLVVTVRATAYDGCVRCDVIDHGPGLPPHLRSKVFQPFQSFGDRRSGGVGLGLAVARGFAEAMAGAVEPRETAGGGLTMRVTLPAAPTS